MQDLAIGLGGTKAAPARAAAAGHAGTFLFGITMALLGAVLPAFSGRLRFDLGQVGTLFLVMNLCLLATSLALGPLMDRYGTRLALVLGPLLVGAALVLLARAAEFQALLWSVGLLGVGGGLVNGAGNTLIADLHDDPHAKAAALNLLGVFFGFGALVLPFAMALLLERLGLAGILLAAAALCVATTVHNGLLTFPPAKHGARVPLRQAVRFLRDPLVLLFAGALFFESGNEFIAGGYVSTFLTQDLGLSVGAVSWVVAAYWAALMLARVGLSRLALRVPGPRIVVGSALGAAGAMVVLAFTRDPAVGVVAATALAAALAGIFPTVLAIVGARYAGYTGTVFGLLFTAALTGGVTLPWLTGQVAAARGLRSALWLTVASFLAVAVLQGVASRRLRSAS
jgi:fucose permease